ncbi:MAG: protein kinase [Deltaproteobacteria bacterium]|nr:protein kinase [Deltaproteobacteria bacterium]
MDDPLIGVVFGDRYRIERCLGAGGVGVVYEATHLGLGRSVAVKVLKDALDAREDTRLRFEREAQVLSRLSHPNIVPLSDYGVHDGVPYLVMERLRGLTAAQLVRDIGVPSVELALRILEGTLRALAYAHGRGVLHRDLKPGNVFLQALPDDPYHVRLLDFGLAKVVDGRLSDVGEAEVGSAPLTRSGFVLGTPAYMAPEQASGGQVDGRSDVYAAGVLLFELLTGRTPFVEKRRSDMLRAHMVREAPSLAQAAPGLSPSAALERLMAAALSKSPGARFQSAQEMLDAIQALPRPAAVAGSVSLVGPMESVSADAETAIALPAARRPMPTRARWALVVLAAVGLVVLLFSLVIWALNRAPEVARDSVVSAPDAGAEVSDAAPPARPDRLARFTTQVDTGKLLSASEQRELRAWQRAHPRSPAASLLLARDATHRGWHGAAIQRYAIVLRIDPGLRDQPAVLDGLIRAATSANVGERARGMVRDLYGAEALDDVRGLLTHTRGRAERGRLRALIRILRALPDAGS